MKQRKLKVYKSYIGNKVIPSITIKAAWLSEEGFNIGANYIVEKSGNSLILTLIPFDSEK